MANEDKFLEICEKAIDSFSIRCNIDKEEITLQTNTESITKGNLALFGHILLDLHEQYQIPMSYEEFTQFKEFPTIQDVVSYFYEKIPQEV